jgi:hypothetical protein
MYEEHLDRMTPELARRAAVRANNFRLRYELYLSQEAADLAEQLCTHLMGLFDLWDRQGRGTTAGLTKATYDNRETLQNLKLLMRTELAGAALTHSRL